ncbi:hypothetical protein EKH79_09340 [Dyella dinghuensis]|uniref:Glycosyltransferase RgtA/B/C/D-like domain-containing protein n=1 Tax=Dyella dinghuensis TaxID=1920169 RepID=A0A3S0RTI0_9GAMM|nr:hypothetical protein [Dyella dinghuensis]RUL64240.1 hypothetical protein EKH79_09340 [Dyella dinghuensis]
MQTSRSLWRNAFAGLICVAAWLFALIYAHAMHPQVADEAVHIPQIQDFLSGHLAMSAGLAMLPGYHLLVAGIMKALTLHSIMSMRVISAVFGLASGVTFYCIRRSLGDASAFVYASQFFLFPLLFPYYFLVYTDILSLALILAALLSALKQRHVIAAVILLASIGVRQNNVIWAAFLPLFVLWPDINKQSFKQIALSKSTWRILLPYALPVIAFFAYWAWHGSISASSKVAYENPELSLHPGNVYFFLFLFLAFFPFQAWTGVRKMFLVIRSKPWLALLFIGAAASIKLRGSPDNYAFADYFLRNAVIAFVHGGWPRYVFGLLVVLGFCSIAFTRFLLHQSWLLYLVCAFYLCSYWLIENRYTMIPFALWMVLRKVENDTAERWTMIGWFIISQFFVWGIMSHRFML